MRGRLTGWLEALGDLFWLRPAFLVVLGVALGEALVWAERAGFTESWVSGGWIYAGGEAGARALLSAVASSAIGVAGTVFSITVAALSLASGQMGPRLLRNFTRDPGNQIVLGTFLGTFACALVLLRTVRSVEEVAFVPHLGVTAALALALLCVAALVWFVHHVANSINVDTVIALVHAELAGAIATLEEGRDAPTGEAPEAARAGAAPRPGPDAEGARGRVLRFAGGGYLRALDDAALADWAAGQGARLRLDVRPGDYLLPGAAFGTLSPPDADAGAAEAAFAAAASLGERQAAAQDLEFAVRQLVEVAVRALSPGINDPFTAVAVLDRLGASLCTLAGRRLPDPVLRRDGRAVLSRHVTDYDGLCDTMFHMIRQSAGGSATVLIRLVEILRQVEGVETDPRRHAALRRHVALALATGRATVEDAAGLADLEARAAGEGLRGRQAAT
ncbi:DUF2254 domain-containing protein [Roseomonas sp. OT10]|uniref:DUF2254 domain-containing protein n=1 Tax=Roseomonas cutis TaxID=2897332 RepID=UPI001E4E6943|nr:DUF2254 domain-containing protein [Roseomonas sp. OT10]UFN48878.1 DUF2254 domain-containing protein [Roseomonas sp. OT10]